MKKTILSAPIALLVLISIAEESNAYGVVVRPVGGPRYVPVHTPAFVGVRPVVGPVVRPAPYVRPVVVAPRPVVGVNRAYVGVGSRPALVSGGVYINRPAGGLYRPGYAYYHSRYAGWHHGYWNGWYQPGIWFGTGVGVGVGIGAGASWLTPPVGAVYANPYYTAAGPSVVPVYDYGLPVPVPAPTLVDQPVTTAVPVPVNPPTANLPANEANAARLLDDARQAFAAKDYEKAQELVDKAVSQSPGDSTLHEFRALVLFARQKYQEAAATINSMLAVGPGWDWQTMRALYADTQTYTSQLRALEEFVRINPSNAASRFLLAYHYLVMDSRDAAAKMLRSVVTLEPKDQVAVRLLEMIEPRPVSDAPPTPGM